MRTLLAAMGLAVVAVVLPIAPAEAMVCLVDGGVTVVDDRQATCVPDGAGRPAAEVLRDAEVDVSRGSGWSFWSSRGDGRWSRETGPAGVEVPDGGLIAWSRGDREPRTEARPLRDVGELEATRPETEKRIGEDHALRDVLRLVGVVATVLVILVLAAWITQRRTPPTP